MRHACGLVRSALLAQVWSRTWEHEVQNSPTHPTMEDTIAALATPVGTSAIALVRASGPGVGTVLRSLLPGGDSPAPRLASHIDYLSLEGKLIDDVVLTWFQGPRSYTGEDLLEIACHGNPFIAQGILQDLFRRGCRPAEPGEFTRRAFLAGRMDLSQAEAVMDLIHARSERALEMARRQLRGGLGKRMQVIIDKILMSLARVEAYIDFPDEDLPSEDRGAIGKDLVACEALVASLLATNHYGDMVRRGLRTVIVGEPNVGKSSLLNRLLEQDRALVSAEPGTTRDFIEDYLQLGSHLLRLVDTAGLNKDPEALEKLGIEKTRERGAEADVILWVLDPQRPTPPVPDFVKAQLARSALIIVVNKADLGAGPPRLEGEFAAVPCVAVSALKGTGIEELKGQILAVAEAFQVGVGPDQVAVNARHARALERALEALRRAGEKLAVAGPVELLASDLREALDACGEIAGKVDNERMLDALFKTFCIGK